MTILFVQLLFFFYNDYNNKMYLILSYLIYYTRILSTGELNIIAIIILKVIGNFFILRDHFNHEKVLFHVKLNNVICPTY